MAGVKETKDFVIACAKYGSAIGKSLEDGKISLLDVQYLYEPLMATQAAVEGFGSVGAELADLDAAELKDLQDTFAQTFDVPQESVEALVENAVDIAIQIWSFVQKLRPAKIPV